MIEGLSLPGRSRLAIMTLLAKRLVWRKMGITMISAFIASVVSGCVTVSCDWPSNSPTANTTASTNDYTPCEPDGTDQSAMQALVGATAGGLEPPTSGSSVDPAY